MANSFFYIFLSPPYTVLYTQSHTHQVPYTPSPTFYVWHWSLPTRVSCSGVDYKYHLDQFLLLLSSSLSTIHQNSFGEYGICFLALDYPLCPSIACQSYDIGRLGTCWISHCHCICISLLWSSPIYHLFYFVIHKSLTCHLLSLTTLTVSHLLPIYCCTYFTPSPNLHHTILLLAISLRSGILRAPQPSFVTPSPFWYSHLLLHICFFLAYLDFHFSSLEDFPLHHHPSLFTSPLAWDILSLRSILHLHCITISIATALVSLLASLLAVGWATCLIALRALHFPLLCFIGPSSYHYLHASQQSNVASLLTHFTDQRSKLTFFSSFFWKRKSAVDKIALVLFWTLFFRYSCCL